MTRPWSVTTVMERTMASQGLSDPTQRQGDVVIKEMVEYDQTTQADEETYLMDVLSANPPCQHLDNKISYWVGTTPGDSGYISTDIKLSDAATTLTLNSPDAIPRRDSPEAKDALPNLKEYANKQQELDKLWGKDSHSRPWEWGRFGRYCRI